MTTPQEVVRLRRAERQALLDVARAYVGGLGPELDVHAAVVVGSVPGATSTAPATSMS